MYPRYYARINVYYNTYTELAMENYFKISHIYDFIKNANTIDEIYDKTGDFNKAMISTVIFSGMAVESLLNDYLATCLGDEHFYSSYDKLSLIGKLILACDAILHIRIDKSKQLFYLINELTKYRNRFIHNKSEDGKKYGMKYEDYEKLKEICDSDDFYSIDKDNYITDFKIAKNAIKTIIELVKFLDLYDKNVHATLKCFGGIEEHYKNDIMWIETKKLLKIKKDLL